MQPSDYIPNEPERNPLHEFICASVAACVASIYPRADPERFVEIVNRTKAPTRAEETLAEYYTRVSAVEDGYCTRNGCDCPCCEVAHAKLRAISYERACASPAAVHCASTDRRDDNEDARLAADAAAAEKEYRDAESEARYSNSSGGGQPVASFAAADGVEAPPPREAVRAAAKGYHETDTDAR